jgi:hypothetical protein
MNIWCKVICISVKMGYTCTINLWLILFFSMILCVTLILNVNIIVCTDLWMNFK